MSLSMRFWLSGAVLPTLVMALVLTAGAQLFQHELERSLDQALLAQAAVESVSLFDGPTREPHLHMASSPLVESVRPFAPEGVLFGPDGLEVMRYPPPTRGGLPREQLAPKTPGAAPVLHTERGKAQRQRVLTVTVAAPNHRPYSLRLRASMAQVDVAVETFRRLSLYAIVVTVCALVLVQLRQGRSLRRRLFALSAHVEALRAGDLSRELAADLERDELSSLRLVLAQATLALRAARDAKERLLADAAHELRTPLTLMRTTLDLALRRKRSDEELRQALSDVREEVDRLASLAGRLLDLAALSHTGQAFETCDVCELAGAAIEAARASSVERGLTLALESAGPALWPVQPEALRRAIDNLLDNALKYAESRVAISVDSAAPDRLAVRVRNDGPSIPEGEREAIFEPFHRVRGSLAGAGLGLAIVRDVAAQHHGRAYVDPSSPGAQFVIELGRPPRA